MKKNSLEGYEYSCTKKFNAIHHPPVRLNFSNKRQKEPLYVTQGG